MHTCAFLALPLTVGGRLGRAVRTVYVTMLVLIGRELKWWFLESTAQLRVYDHIIRELNAKDWLYNLPNCPVLLVKHKKTQVTQENIVLRDNTHVVLVRRTMSQEGLLTPTAQRSEIRPKLIIIRVKRETRILPVGGRCQAQKFYANGIIPSQNVDTAR